MTLKWRKGYWWLVFLLVCFLAGLWSINSLVEQAFEKQIDSFNAKSAYHIDYETFKASSFTGSAHLSGIRIRADKQLTGQQPHLSIGSIQLDRLNIASLLFKKRMEVGSLEVDDLNVLFKPQEMNSLSSRPQRSSGTNSSTDDFSTFKLDRFLVRTFDLVMLDSTARDTLRHLKGGRFELRGIHLVADTTSDLGYRYINDKVELELERENLLLAKESQEISLGSFYYSFAEQKIVATDLAVRNLPDLPVASSRAFYSKTFADSQIDTLIAYGLQIKQPWDFSEWRMDSLLVSSPRLSLLKDQRKPMDRSKRRPLPPDLLQKSKQRFRIDKLAIRNGELAYTEIYETGEMRIGMKRLAATVTHIYSQLDSLEPPPLTISMRARFLNQMPFELLIEYPDPLTSQAFRFEGRTGSAQLSSFTPVLRHSAGLSISDGQLESLTFNGWGNAYRAQGQLSMRYRGLQANLLREGHRKRNKVLSFLANQILRDSNPIRGRLKVARMEFERDLYKGLGNYIFKTIETGLLNTFNPLGGNVE